MSKPTQPSVRRAEPPKEALSSDTRVSSKVRESGSPYGPKFNNVDHELSFWEASLQRLNTPTWSWSLYSSRFSVNQAFVDVLGVDCAHLGDMLGLFSDSGRDRFLSSVGSALRHKASFSLTVASSQDTTYPLNISAMPIEDSSGHVALLGHLLPQQSFNEVSGQPSEQRLQQLLDSMRSVILYLDRWGLVVHGNRHAENWMCLPEVLGKTFMEVLPDWDDVAERHREIMQVIRTGTPQWDSIESRYEGDQQQWYRVDKIPTMDTANKVTGVLLVIEDVTRERGREYALRESDARYRAFVANSSEAMFRYDISPPIETSLDSSLQAIQLLKSAALSECNGAMDKLLSITNPKALLGDCLQKIFPGDTSTLIRRFVDNGYSVVDEELRSFSVDGEPLFLQVSALGIVEGGVLHRLWGTARDVTEKSRTLAKLEFQATHDALTLLPNRSKLSQELEEVLRNRRTGQKCALLLVDLDRFKEINDTLGHQVGDRLLQQIGPRLETELSEFPTVVARLGGDEFAILLSNIRNIQQAVVIGHRVLDALGEPFAIENLETEVSASIGISCTPSHSDDGGTLLRYAEVAMYEAKSKRLGVAVYQPDFDPYTPKRLTLMNDLGRAIRENELSLYFQPKINLKTQQVYGFEALLRWIHPEHGFIPPGEFIPLVELTQLIHTVTLWVVKNTIIQAKYWYDQGYEFSIAANVSAQNLLGETLVETLDELLTTYGLPAHLLELEITESTIMADPERALKALNEIHRLGVTLAIDDFGTGYSSLAYLKRLPVSTLKIDGSFVTDMLQDEQDEIIVHSTINLAHNLGLKIVAEGVEYGDVLTRLTELGCDEAQGYFIARPQPADIIDSWLQNCEWFTATP